MIGIEDLYSIAVSMDEQMLLMNTKHKDDYRDRLIISLEIPRLDFMSIDEHLYEREHGTMVGYDGAGDIITINVLGINFKLTYKKEAE